MDVLELITRHEGKRNRPYCDKCGAYVEFVGQGWLCSCLAAREAPGNLTIGIGHNLGGRPLSERAMAQILDDDYEEALLDLVGFAWFKGLNDARRAALLDLRFNVGGTKFRGFERMMAALAKGKFIVAAYEMGDSKWARQVGKRAIEDADLLRTGDWAAIGRV